jgi:hypothetical protein
MTYKEGGTQFINRKLKKGDNSKIYNHWIWILLEVSIPLARW